ncbi:MAG: putative zinc-binding protein [Candidatus Caldatribacteriota bacterium]|jgi:uncharacterized metal-binding protein|nr:putative zinc-binding protein [Atribacterota bacterium]MDD4288684.1 putative zinc-binding protein [Atribacterota bacterium]MDD4765121.1 putative zinc-binding protein [Atribacterota bacterium]
MGECGCNNTKTRLIYSCSGCADVGEIADQVARKLTRDGYGKMTCLASISAGISGTIASAKGADENITLDGCSVACARKTLENIGVKPTETYILTDMYLEKGKTSVSEEIINVVSEQIKHGIVSRTQPKKEQENNKNTGCSCGSC